MFTTSVKKIGCEMFKNIMKNPYQHGKLLTLSPELYKNKLSIQDLLQYDKINDMAYVITRQVIPQHILTNNELKRATNHAFNFEAPIHKYNDIFFLELFHGPTQCFKDFGLRFCAALVQHEKYTIVTATSGDTGGATVDAFECATWCNVVVLYPKRGVSHIQELQMTTHSSPNIHCYAVDGSFDDCQNLVKQILSTYSCKSTELYTTNSINIIRIIAQMVYYIYGYVTLVRDHGVTNTVRISVPSGNLGNLTAGLFANQLIGDMDMKFTAAVNKNDNFKHYLYSNRLPKTRVVKTCSSAMDINNPNNLPRIEQLYNHDISLLQQDVTSVSVDDTTTKNTIHMNSTYPMCPHSAVGYNALTRTMDKNETGMVLCTAHPAKFSVSEHYCQDNIYADLVKKPAYRHYVPNNISCIRHELLELEKPFDKIVFIGMPASGKTFMGQRIAKRLGFSFIDTDDLIRNAHNMSLCEYISTHGLDQFKIMEKKILETIDIDSKTIVATGGSAIYYQSAMKHLQKQALVVHLDAACHTINDRIPDPQSRGVVLTTGRTLYDLYLERTPLYQKYADITILSDQLDEMVDELDYWM